jgi:hypothetical protein
MAKFRIGDIVVLQGRRAKVVWYSENASEIEAMDEYIVEFENKQRQFIVAGDLYPKQSHPINDRERDSDHCQPQGY